MEEILNIESTETAEQQEPELEIEIEEDGGELPTEEDTKESVPEDTAPETEEQDEQPKQVPLAALHEERNRRREIERKLSETSAVLDRLVKEAGARDINELSRRMDDISIRSLVENQGMDERAAKVLIGYKRELDSLKLQVGAEKFDGEISTLKTSPFYSDIEEVADEVKAYAADKSISAKEAYNALYAEKRMETLQREAEQKALRNISAKQSKKIDALSGTTAAAPAKRTIKLTAAEAEIAALAGITPAEYAKYKKE